MLAGSPDGMTEAMLLAHGFTVAVEMRVDLIRAGLAAGQCSRDAPNHDIETSICFSPIRRLVPP